MNAHEQNGNNENIKNSVVIIYDSNHFGGQKIFAFTILDELVVFLPSCIQSGRTNFVVLFNADGFD